MCHLSPTNYTGGKGILLRRAGSLAPISVLEPNHIVELSCRHLEQEAIGHSHHTVKGSGWNMKHRFRSYLVFFEPFNIDPGHQLERAFEDPKGFFFDLVVLETQRLTLANEENLTDVVLASPPCALF